MTKYTSTANNLTPNLIIIVNNNVIQCLIEWPLTLS